MGNLQARSRLSAKGLGNLHARETYPNNDADFVDLGILGNEGTEIHDVVDPDEIKDEEGKIQEVLFDAVATRLVTNLKQVSIDEWNFVRLATGKRHALRYAGLANNSMFQYFCWEQAVIIPQTNRKFSKDQVIPFEALGINKDTDGYYTPDYYLVETKSKIHFVNLMFWLSPRRVDYPGYGTSKLMDVSGFARHGDLNSDYANMWKTGTPETYLELDGVNDYVNFGNILNDNAINDILFEIWINIPAANGTSQVLFSKKAAAGAANPGYMLTRDINNKVSFKIADGTSEVEVLSTSNVLQNTWKLITIAIDRDGNAQLYIDGVADGAAVSVAAIGSANNAVDFIIGRIGSTYGNIRFDDTRSHKFADGLPSSIATIAARHYSAEKSYYGV